jgi:hypothetical protein
MGGVEEGTGTTMEVDSSVIEVATKSIQVVAYTTKVATQTM